MDSALKQASRVDCLRGPTLQIRVHPLADHREQSLLVILG